MSPSVDPSMSLHPSAMITQQMGQLSLGNTGAVSGILGYPSSHAALIMKSVQYNSVENSHKYYDKVS